MTEKLYYDDSYIRTFVARVLGCEKVGGRYEITLSESAFYPEGGGQPGDMGTLGAARVQDTKTKGGATVHITDTPLNPGEYVAGEIDWPRRFDLMQQHSGEHIVSGLVNSRYGLENVGFHMGKDTVTIDFDGVLTPSQLREIEGEANRKIWDDNAVEIGMYSGAALGELAYRSKKELTGDVRIVRFPGSDTCACCGTHVKHTGEIGCIRLLSVKPLRSGVRVEMISGERCYRYFAAVADENHAVSVALSAPERETNSALSRLFEDIAQQNSRTAQLENRLFERLASEYTGKAVVFEESLSSDSLRRLCDTLIKHTGALCAAFSGTDSEGYKYAIGRPEGDVRMLIKHMNTALNGRGGGKGAFAQGSVLASRDEIEKYFNAEDRQEL